MVNALSVSPRRRRGGGGSSSSRRVMALTASRNSVLMVLGWCLLRPAGFLPAELKSVSLALPFAFPFPAAVMLAFGAFVLVLPPLAVLIGDIADLLCTLLLLGGGAGAGFRLFIG